MNSQLLYIFAAIGIAWILFGFSSVVKKLCRKFMCRSRQSV